MTLRDTFKSELLDQLIQADKEIGEGMAKLEAHYGGQGHTVGRLEVGGEVFQAQARVQTVIAVLERLLGE